MAEEQKQTGEAAREREAVMRGAAASLVEVVEPVEPEPPLPGTAVVVGQRAATWGAGAHYAADVAPRQAGREAETGKRAKQAVLEEGQESVSFPFREEAGGVVACFPARRGGRATRTVP